MAIHAGESVRLFADLYGWDGNPLRPETVSRVSCTVYDQYGAVVVPDVDMTWHAGAQRFFYQWETPSVAGTYTVEVTVLSDEGRSTETRKVRLEGVRPVVVRKHPLMA